MNINKKAIMLGFGVLLCSLDAMAKTSEVDVDLSKIGGSVKFCSSCRLKLPEELKEKTYYYVDGDFVYDEKTEQFVGLKKVEDELKKVGIFDYKIDTFNEPNGSTLYFTVKSASENKKYIPLVLSKIGVTISDGVPGFIGNDVESTDSYATCYKRAHTGALQKLKAYYDDTKYNYDYDETDGTISKYLNEDTYEISVCLSIGDIEKKEAEENEE